MCKVRDAAGQGHKQDGQTLDKKHLGAMAETLPEAAERGGWRAALHKWRGCRGTKGAAADCRCTAGRARLQAAASHHRCSVPGCGIHCPTTEEAQAPRVT